MLLLTRLALFLAILQSSQSQKLSGSPKLDELVARLEQDVLELRDRIEEL